MITETPEEKSLRLKRSVTIGHRKRRNLCILCGKDKHEDVCIENYDKADNRPTEAEIKELNLKKQKEAVVTYRKKKLLCLRCGQDYHTGKCKETYEIADNRTIEEKIDRPAIIPTPKFKPIGITEEIDSRKNKEIRIKLNKTQNIKLQRDFIVLSILKSKNENVIEFSCLNVLSRKFKDSIVCIIGDLEKSFTYSDILKIHKLTNIKKISDNEQDIVNHLYGCSTLYSFENDYTDYCQKHGIKVYIFDNDKNVTGTLKEAVYKR